MKPPSDTLGSVQSVLIFRLLLRITVYWFIHGISWIFVARKGAPITQSKAEWAQDFYLVWVHALVGHLRNFIQHAKNQTYSSLIGLFLNQGKINKVLPESMKSADVSFFTCLAKIQWKSLVHMYSVHLLACKAEQITILFVSAHACAGCVVLCVFSTARDVPSRPDRNISACEWIEIHEAHL